MPESPQNHATFQKRTAEAIETCFGYAALTSAQERNHRFIEEALELVQANGCTLNEVCGIIFHVFSRPKGDVSEEIGDVLMCVAALAQSAGVIMDIAAENRLCQFKDSMPEVYAKWQNKPDFTRSSLLTQI